LANTTERVCIFHRTPDDGSNLAEMHTSSHSTASPNSQEILENSIRVRRSTDDNAPEVEIIGMNFEYESDKKRIEYDQHGTPRSLENMDVKIRLFGKFTNQTIFKFSKFQKCDDPNNHEQGVEVRSYISIAIISNIYFHSW